MSNFIMDIIDDYKTELPDSLYMKICDKLAEINKKEQSTKQCFKLNLVAIDYCGSFLTMDGISTQIKTRRSSCLVFVEPEEISKYSPGDDITLSTFFIENCPYKFKTSSYIPELGVENQLESKYIFLGCKKLE